MICAVQTVYVQIGRVRLYLLTLLTGLLLIACHADAPITRLRRLDLPPYLMKLDSTRTQELDSQLNNATIFDMQQMMAAGELSAETLTIYYLARIEKYDGKLNSILELNPDAVALALALDAERAAGKLRGPLHGIPILLKDNIATGDKMHNTAGAAVLRDHRAPRDAFIAMQLRNAGAVLLGKANMSEWAYFMASKAPSGFTALGGQVVNPFGASYKVWGSSTGSAVAASARFAAATIGTETTGSIIAPAAVNGATGLRPTLGLVSRDLIIPITAQLDSAGPIGRNVTDLAILLTVLSARDENDFLAPLADGLHGNDFASALGSVSLDGLRVGLPSVEGYFSAEDARRGLARAIAVLEAAGATVVPTVIDQTQWQSIYHNYKPLLAGSMAADLAHYFAEADAPIASLADVVAFNGQDLTKYAPYGQDLLELAVAAPMKPAEHARQSAARRAAAYAIMRQSADDHQLDLILSFDNWFSLFYAAAGTPAVVVPIGADETGQPHGATFVAIEPGTDAHLLAIAYAFEQAIGLGAIPDLTANGEG